MNPVSADMVKAPADYPWSSYTSNAEGRYTDWITPHQVYLGLGSNPPERQAAYRGLFHESVSPDVVNAIVRGVQKNLPTGSDRFREEIGAALDRSIGVGQPGRPRKKNGQ